MALMGGGFEELRDAFEALEELERQRAGRSIRPPFDGEPVEIVVVEEAPGAFVDQDGQRGRVPLGSPEQVEELMGRWVSREPSFRERLEEIRPRREPTFADVMDEFARRALSKRRHPSSQQPVDDVGGPGTTGP